MIGFIGAGKMAEAIVSGILRGGTRPDGILAADVNTERLADLRKRLGIGTTPDNRAVAAACEIVFLAVKPQQLDAACRAMTDTVGPRHLVISIAAGKPLDRLAALLPGARLIRVMPNLACTVGEGMSVLTCAPGATAADGATARSLLAGCGPVTELPETLFDAVTALSGSGPAFFAWVLDQFARGAQAEGLPRPAALMLARQTLRGTAGLLNETFAEPAALAEAVTSHKGTTAAGRAVLENETTARILQETIRAAARRSRELSQA